MELVISILCCLCLILSCSYIIYVFIRTIKMNKEHDKFIAKLNKEEIEKKAKLELENIKLKIALKSIKVELTKNPNGSVSNLASRINKLLPKEAEE